MQYLTRKVDLRKAAAPISSIYEPSYPFRPKKLESRKTDYEFDSLTTVYFYDRRLPRLIDHHSLFCHLNKFFQPCTISSECRSVLVCFLVTIHPPRIGLYTSDINPGSGWIELVAFELDSNHLARYEPSHYGIFDSLPFLAGRLWLLLMPPISINFHESQS